MDAVAGMSPVELLVGGVVGAVFGYALPKAYEAGLAQWASRRVEEFRRRSSNAQLYDWIVDYYRDWPGTERLHSIRIGPKEMFIPFLTRPEWLVNYRIGEGPTPLLIPQNTDDRFPVDAAALRRRERMGQRLFDDPALYFRGISTTGERLELQVGACSYFEVASSLLALEDETFRQTSRLGRIRRPRYREQRFGVDDGQFRGRPFSVAASVAVVLCFDESRELLLHSRSHETVTYGGMQAVIPYFGMVPIGGGAGRSGRTGWREGPHDRLVEANVIKEYCEELFSYDDLILDSQIRVLGDQWLWAKPQAQELRDLLDEGGATLRCLGFGFDGLNGSATVSFMLLIEDVEASERIERTLSGNWEVAQRSRASESLRLVPVRCEVLDPLLEQRVFTYGSAFTVTRVLELYGDRSASVS